MLLPIRPLNETRRIGEVCAGGRLWRACRVMRLDLSHLRGLAL